MNEPFDIKGLLADRGALLARIELAMALDRPPRGPGQLPVAPLAPVPVPAALPTSAASAPASSALVPSALVPSAAASSALAPSAHAPSALPPADPPKKP